MATEEPTAVQRKGGTEDLKGKVTKAMENVRDRIDVQSTSKENKKQERKDARQEKREERKESRRKTPEEAADIALKKAQGQPAGVEAEQPTAEEIERVRYWQAGGLSPDEITGSGEVDIVEPTPEEIEKVRKWTYDLSQMETTGGDGSRYGVVPRAITPEYDESTAPGQNLEPGGPGPQPEEGNVIGIRRASPQEQADLDRQKGLRYEFMEGEGPEGQDILRPSRPEDVIDVKFEDDSLDVEGGYTNPDLTPRAEGREAAADAGMLKKSMDDADFDYTQKSSWSGLGGYNYTYVPDPQGRLGKIRVDSAPGSRMKGKSAVVSATSKNAKGENIFEAIMGERLRGKTGAALSDAQQSKMRSAPPPPPPGKTDTGTDTDTDTDTASKWGYKLPNGQNIKLEGDYDPQTVSQVYMDLREAYGKNFTVEDIERKVLSRIELDKRMAGAGQQPTQPSSEGSGQQPTQPSSEGAGQQPTNTDTDEGWTAKDPEVVKYLRRTGQLPIALESEEEFNRRLDRQYPASSEGEPAGEVDKVTLREDYQGGDPTPDEIRSVVSELSPSAKIAKQKFTAAQTEAAVRQAESVVQQAQDNLAEAIKITETTGDATAQTEAEAILDRERKRLQEAIVLNTLEKKESRALDRDVKELREAERLRAAERYKYEDPEARPTKWTR